MKITTTGLNAQQLHDHATSLVKNLKQNAADLGIVLDSIKDGKHYKTLGYSNFNEYCKGAHGFTRDYASKVITHAKTIQNVYNCIQNEPPQTEGQTRELSKAPAEKQAEVWVETIERTGKEQPTALEIKHTVDMAIDVEYEEVDTKTTNDVKLNPNEKKALSIISKEEGGKTTKDLFPYFDKKQDVKRSCSDLVKKGKLEVVGKIGSLNVYNTPSNTIHTKPLRERFEAVKNGETVLVKSEEKITEEFMALWEEYGFSERYRLHVVTMDKSPFYNPYNEHEEDYENYKCWRHWIDNKPSVRKQISMIKKTFVLMNIDDHRYIQYALDKSKKA